jgi:heme A synthase
MDPLLLVTGVLLLISGLLSLRSGTRLGALVPTLALAQIVVGASAFMGGLVVRLTGSWGLTVTVSSLVLMLASALWHAARLREARRIRNHSEGARLATYVKYLSRRAGPD